VDERLRDLPVRRRDDAAEGGARDTHAPRRLLLVEPLEVGEPQGLELVESHRDALGLAAAPAGRSEDRCRWLTSDQAAAMGSGHYQASRLIMRICAQLSRSAAPARTRHRLRWRQQGERLFQHTKEVSVASFEQLKAKYQPVIDLAKARGVSLKNVNLDGEKLFIKGDAPNQAIKNEVWEAIKKVDAKYADLAADIGIDANLPVPAKIYEVVGGDTLSKIAKKFYGDANKYMKIFEANKDQLKDPDKINVGQKLKIPE
jgi:LysM repeat protein